MTIAIEIHILFYQAMKSVHGIERFMS